jgi:hypothetical protein
MDEYIGRYSERDVNGVTELCLAPFLAIREGVPIHMPDRDAVRDHFGAMIDAYRGGGVATWKRIESDTRELGEHAVFTTVRCVPIHMPDRDAVRDHFGAMIDAYRGGGVATWKRIESDTRELGEHAVFTTVRWNALDSEGNLLRDTRTTYHLLATPDGWRLLSYTNHF